MCCDCRCDCCQMFVLQAIKNEKKYKMHKAYLFWFCCYAKLHHRNNILSVHSHTYICLYNQVSWIFRRSHNTTHTRTHLHRSTCPVSILKLYRDQQLLFIIFISISRFPYTFVDDVCFYGSRRVRVYASWHSKTHVTFFQYIVYHTHIYIIS